MVLHVIDDNQNNLWVSATDAVYRISADRNAVRIYGEGNGVHTNTFLYGDNYRSPGGKLFFGDQNGYYAFFPEQITESSYPPQISITGFKVGDKEIKPGDESGIKEPVYKAKEITLPHNQNTFTIDFVAIQYTSPGAVKYQYMLQNYDNVWHDAGAEKRAFFFNIQPGKYVFRVRAMNSDGIWSEKQLSVVISPPWWRTPWAITLFSLCFIAILWGAFYYRSRRLREQNRVLEEKVNDRTAQLQQSLKELKATQTQLIQSEKMASLGELTAGIAHEIQNPLNFVNNFSEVNTELIEELKEQLATGNAQEAMIIADDIKENEQKISHHGKRADAIVKGMLQHSRTTTGQKEPTNINALADEYLRLSYHGLRAKDKDFNAGIETDYDGSIDKIEVVPQDIGRVLLNLLNNAFYAVTEKKKASALTKKTTSQLFQ
jgi:signal transduction histidine kinase